MRTKRLHCLVAARTTRERARGYERAGERHALTRISGRTKATDADRRQLTHRLPDRHQQMIWRRISAPFNVANIAPVLTEDAADHGAVGAVPRRSVSYPPAVIWGRLPVIRCWKGRVTIDLEVVLWDLTSVNLNETQFFG